MPIRVGILSAAHVHAPSFAHAFKKSPRAEYVGVWDDDESRGLKFCAEHSGVFCKDLHQFLNTVDAVCISSENTKHRALAEVAAKQGKHILCEKPLATTVEDAEAMIAAANDAGVILAVAFPCPFSPAFQKLCARVKNGEIGQILSACATNRGTCPHGWFVDRHLSGGGAMIDHTVHVADLLKRLLNEEPTKVKASVGSNLYSQDWEDTAMLNLDYASGIFATLDSSWSRPAFYKTWGDVTMNVVGTLGVIELDMFGPAVDVFKSGTKTHSQAGFSSDLDRLMIEDFLSAIEEKRAPMSSGADGLAAVRVACSAYESLREVVT